MPQMVFMLSPKAQAVLKSNAQEVMGQLDKFLAPLITMIWGVPEWDIACSAMNLTYTRDEADVQIEVRYTAGADEYQTGAPFDPPPEQREELMTAMQKRATMLLRDWKLTSSIWPKPFRGSGFKMRE